MTEPSEPPRSTATRAPKTKPPSSPPPPRPLVELLASAALVVGAVDKNLRNEAAGYSARSIDDILNAVHTPLATLGIVIRPEVLERIAETRQSRQGGALYYVALRVAYHFHGPAGDAFTVTVWGEAMDSSDKASNKALSAALKMALIQTLTIPVVGTSEDADHDHPEADAPPVMASPRAALELVERLEAFWIAQGNKRYPEAWKAQRIPPAGQIREFGITAVDAVAALEILESS